MHRTGTLSLLQWLLSLRPKRSTIIKRDSDRDREVIKEREGGDRTVIKKEEELKVLPVPHTEEKTIIKKERD